MKNNKGSQKGSTLFLVIVIIGIIIFLSQYSLKSIFESKQFKDNMAYLKSLATNIFTVAVVDPTVADLKNKASSVGINQANIDKLNKGQMPDTSFNINSLQGLFPPIMAPVPIQNPQPQNLQN